MRNFFVTICLCSMFNLLSAQELDCRITVNTDNIEGTNKDIYTELGNRLTEFMNSRRWTDAIFQNEERINCSFIITITSAAGDNYSGNLQVQSNRPVFNSSYTTPIFNFKDENFKFTYAQADRLEFNENTYESNLMSVMAFYVNVILGLNFDSFSRCGGTKYFEKAEAIAALAQSSDDLGWKAFQSDKNRYAIISEYRDERLRKLRDVSYEYHRLGLDEMFQMTEKGRTKIFENLPYLQELNREKPFSIALQLFAESKMNEIMDMFQDATADERKKVYDIMTALLPTQSSKLKSLLNN
ncbi:MAG: DUF4835 family protein [Paludibacteraceae bacterium]|nr:DUF4835 family protein [Paludibacteraceae bacterium]